MKPRKDMDPRDAMEPDQLDTLGRIFSDYAAMEEAQNAWPEAGRLRELALALQGVFAQQDERHALCDEFLDLCSIHGESHPGESRLARTFLARIERGEVGSPTEPEKKPW
jgi:hypothetical protein